MRFESETSQESLKSRFGFNFSQKKDAKFTRKRDMKKEPGFGLKTWLGERAILPDIVVVSISHSLRLRLPVLTSIIFSLVFWSLYKKRGKEKNVRKMKKINK